MDIVEVDVMIMDPTFCQSWKRLFDALRIPCRHYYQHQLRYNLGDLDLRTMWIGYLKIWQLDCQLSTIREFCTILYAQKFGAIKDTIESKYRYNMDAIIIIPNNIRTDIGFLLPLPAPDFAGRTKELNILGGSNKPVIIWGLGGVGKSQLAFKFVHYYREQKQVGVIYLSGKSDEEFNKSVHKYAKCFDLNWVGVHDEVHKSLDVFQKLIKCLNVDITILILDNVGEYAEGVTRFFTTLVPYVLQETNIFLIVTCRYKYTLKPWPDQFYYIQLGTLSSDEAAEFIKAKVGSTYNTEDRINMCNSLYNFPLLMRQGVACIMEHNLNMEDMLSVCQVSEMIGFESTKKFIKSHTEHGETPIRLLELLSLIDNPEGETVERINRLYDTLILPESLKCNGPEAQETCKNNLGNGATAGFHFDSKKIDNSVKGALMLLQNYSVLKHHRQPETPWNKVKITFNEIFKHVLNIHSFADRKRDMLKMIRSFLYYGYHWIKFDLRHLALKFWDSLTTESSVCVTAEELGELKTEFFKIWQIGRVRSDREEFNVFLGKITKISNSNFTLAAMLLRNVLVRFLEYDSSEYLNYCKAVQKMSEGVQGLCSRNTHIPKGTVVSVLVDNINTLHFIECRYEEKFPSEFAQALLFKIMSSSEHFVFKVHIFISLLSHYNYFRRTDDALHFVENFFEMLKKNSASKGTILFFLHLGRDILKESELHGLLEYCLTKEREIVNYESEVDLILTVVMMYVSISTKINVELEFDVFFTTPFKKELHFELLSALLIKTGRSSNLRVHNLCDKIMKSMNSSPVQLADAYLFCRAIKNWLGTFGFESNPGNIPIGSSHRSIICRVLKSDFIIEKYDKDPPRNSIDNCKSLEDILRVIRNPDSDHVLSMYCVTKMLRRLWQAKYFNDKVVSYLKQFESELVRTERIDLFHHTLYALGSHIILTQVDDGNISYVSEIFDIILKYSDEMYIPLFYELSSFYKERSLDQQISEMQIKKQYKELCAKLGLNVSKEENRGIDENNNEERVPVS